MEQNHARAVHGVGVLDEKAVWDAEAGTFYITADGNEILYSCPCGCGQMIALPLKRAGEGKGWRWDGNRERPTLEPSIRRLDGCLWHGWLRAGTWEQAGDSGK